MKRSFGRAGALAVAALAPLCQGAAQEEGPERRPARVLFERLDADRDGSVSAEEWKGFFRRLDEDQDGTTNLRQESA